MSLTRRYYTDKRGKRHWKLVYNVSRGPLKGRRYASERNYRKALGTYKERETASSKAHRAAEKARKTRASKSVVVRATRGIETDERYNELLQTWIDRGSGYNRNKLARFKELYRKAKATDFNRCPPADDTNEDGAPYAYLLDFIGVRPLEEFGWVCVGDTKEA